MASMDNTRPMPQTGSKSRMVLRLRKEQAKDRAREMVLQPLSRHRRMSEIESDNAIRYFRGLDSNREVASTWFHWIPSNEIKRIFVLRGELRRIANDLEGKKISKKIIVQRINEILSVMEDI
jgi:hypothetical protein